MASGPTIKGIWAILFATALLSKRQPMRPGVAQLLQQNRHPDDKSSHAAWRPRGPRFPLKGSFKGDVDIGMDIAVDIALDDRET